MRTVGTPIMMALGGGGTRAAGSMIMSVCRAAPIMPIRTVTEQGVVIAPGPWGLPGPAGGGGFTIGQVCVSNWRHAGFPPMSTVGQPGPRTGGPCIVAEVTVAAGNPIVLARLVYHYDQLIITMPPFSVRVASPLMVVIVPWRS